MIQLIAEESARIGNTESEFRYFLPARENASVGKQCFPIVSECGRRMYLCLEPIIQVFVRSSEGLKKIPSFGVPRQLLNSPCPISLLNHSAVRLRRETKTNKIIGFFLKQRLLGGGQQEKATSICKEIIDNFLEARYQNVINRAQLLSLIPIEDIQNPSTIADSLLECVYSFKNDPKKYSVLSELGDHSMLIILKMALHFYIVALSRGEQILQDKTHLLQVPLNKTENRLYIEIKYLKYLSLNQTALKDLLKEDGIKALKFVGSLGLSKVMELRQSHLSKGTPFFDQFSAKMKESLIGRYLILICLRQKTPKSFSLRVVKSMMGTGWKTLYRIAEVATTWCLKRNITKSKFDRVITNVILPLAKHNDLSPRYNWRVREKAIASLCIIDSFKNLSFVLREIKENERDKRVLQIFENKASARYDIGHTVWIYQDYEEKQNYEDIQEKKYYKEKQDSKKKTNYKEQEDHEEKKDTKRSCSTSRNILSEGKRSLTKLFPRSKTKKK